MLRFRTFGAIDLREDNGERFDDLLGQTKRLALLAYLADRQPSGPVRREQLLELLWPDSAPSQARNALSSTLSRLRRRLGDEIIRGSGEETLWLSAEHFRSDVAAFQRANQAGRHRKALDLYRGRFLKGFRPPASRAFGAWLDTRRGFFHRAACDAGVQAGQAAHERGDLSGAEYCFRRAHNLKPIEEEPAQRLVQVLAEQGERGDAIRLYEAFRERLGSELNLTPSQEFDDLVVRIQSAEADGPDVFPMDHAGSDAESTAREAQEEADGDHRSRTGPWTVPPVLWSTALLIALALAGAGLWAWKELGPTSAGGRTSTDRIDFRTSATVAVLPFEGIGQAPRAHPFLRGFRERLLTELSRIPEVRVISETSADRFRNSNLPLPAIADSLQARWILEGAIQQAGDTVQVHAQLSDATADAYVWTETFQRDRSTQHLFGLQRELTRRIVDAVELELTTRTGRDWTAPPTESARAFELYLEARGLVYTNAAPEEEVNRAIRLYHRALDLDSTFAEAWAGLADAYADRIWGHSYPLSWADSGIAAARNAIRFAPKLPDGYTQLGDNLGTIGQTEAQIDAYRKALRLRPDHHPTLINLTYLLSQTGRLADAMRWLDRARQALPTSADLLPLLVTHNAWMGREEVAEAWLRYARAHGHDLLDARFSVELYVHNDVEGARSTLERLRKNGDDPYGLRQAALAVYEGHWNQALPLYRKFATSHHLLAGAGQPGSLSAGPGWAVALHRLGREEQARTVARKTLKAARQAYEGFGQAPTRRVQEAVAFLVLGDTARAVVKLSEAVEHGYRNLPVVQSVPVLDPLRQNLEFKTLVARINAMVADERQTVEREEWGTPPDRFLNQ